ncbi:MAG TPA: ABC transporter substrate-binding protein [Burkholderiales bacterium]|nr:ABC transporter substrate-binding protein [Burkholderiales bacterium]
MKKIITLLLALGFSSISQAATSASAPVADDNDATTSPTSKSGKTVVVVASSAGSCADGTPCEVIKSSAQILSDAVNQNISEKKAVNMIQNSIVPQIDFTIMTRLAMGAQWKQATPDQQAQIVGLFKQMLVYSYTNALSKLKGAQVSISSSTISGEKQNKAVVNSSLKMPNNGDSNNQPINIEYDLAKIGSAWKIYDVKIEKVSIVTTYRTQFGDEVQKDGITGLITQLQTKVNNLKGNK